MQTFISSDVNLAIELLLQGELVAIPTETVYGLAANALEPAAVAKIFEAKERPSFNPLIVHVACMDMVEAYALNTPKKLQVLMQHCWPGPLTVLLEKSHTIPDLVTAGSPKVGLRMPSHALTKQLLSRLPFPLAAPSANLFGYVSPTTAQHVFEGLNGRVAMVLDGGPCAVGVESTIVDYEKDAVIIRRNGGISKEEIEVLIGEPVVVETSADAHPVAPGMLKSHYATRKPLYFIEQGESFPSLEHKRIGVIGWGSEDEIARRLPLRAARLNTLSATKRSEEAAANLFAVLRQMDADGYIDAIVALPVHSTGIGIAINDRLRRADHRNISSSL